MHSNLEHTNNSDSTAAQTSDNNILVEDCVYHLHHKPQRLHPAATDKHRSVFDKIHAAQQRSQR
jgi:hypothetical protein